MLKRSKKQITWFVFIFVTLLLGFLFYFNPVIGEYLYGYKIYPIVRKVFNVLFLPFDQRIAFILIAIFLYILFKNIIKKEFFSAFKFLLFLLALFYWLWGFNYYRIPLSEKMHLTFAPVSDSTHYRLTMETLEKCIMLSEKLDGSSDAIISKTLLLSGLQMADTLSFLAKSTNEVVAVYPPTLFLRISILGMYFPYTGQAQYESAIGPIDKAFTMAHEWCHAAGIAPEHEADFLAYLICISNDNTTVQYSAHMHLLYELLFYYKIRDPELFITMTSMFTEKMKTQIEARRIQFEKYDGPVSEMSDEMIDNYLKFNQQEGLQDYHRLSEYVFAWDSK
jgi:hypothetical protein